MAYSRPVQNAKFGQNLFKILKNESPLGFIRLSLSPTSYGRPVVHYAVDHFYVIFLYIHNFLLGLLAVVCTYNQLHYYYYLKFTRR